MSADPAAVQALLDDASGAVAVGDLEEASVLFRRATGLDPASFDAWHALGMCLMRTGDLKSALGAGLMATSLKPNDLLGWTGLSQIYVKLGNIAEAEAAKGNARILSLGGRIVKENAAADTVPGAEPGPPPPAATDA